VTPDNLILKISQGQTEAFYFLYGPETFYQTEVIQALIKKWITEDNRDFNLETFDARESTVSHWLGSARTLSFVGGTKLVVVRNLHEAVPQDQDAQTLIDYAQSPIPEACVVVTADKVDRKRKLFKTLTKLKTAVACEAPKENEHWLRKRAEEAGYSLSSDAARFLINRVGPRPGILAKELEKTLLYAGKNKSVSERDVAEVVGESKLENVFALTDALKTKNPEKALRLLNNQIDHGEEPIKILGTIAWQLRMIWQVKHYQQKNLPSGQIAKAMGANPYIVEKALQHTRRFSTQQLRSGYLELVNADRSLKSTTKDPMAVMQTLILNLCC
jgi:DNA polymerase-3 subunit delta|tara:strand:+ start:117 stop:1106 length:990 start_codon:yes stop_codon:yes gene_type:complete